MDRQRRSAQQRSGRDRGERLRRGKGRCGGNQRCGGGRQGSGLGRHGLGRKWPQQCLRRPGQGGFEAIDLLLRLGTQPKHIRAPERHREGRKHESDT